MSDALRLSDIAHIFDGPHATPTRTAEGPYFLNISSLNAGRLDLAQSDRLSEEDFVVWTRRVQPREGDILFSYETRLGHAAIMPADLRACLGRRMALLRPDLNRILPRYLLYYYLSPAFQTLIDRNTIHGATVNRISLSTMGDWSVQIPGIAEQARIAAVLGAIDKKIATNSSVTQSSEELAVTMLGQCHTHTSLSNLVIVRRSTVNPAAMSGESVWHYSLPAFDEGKRPVLDSPHKIKSSKFSIERPSVMLSKLNPRFPRVWNLARTRQGVSIASTEFVVLEPTVCSTGVLAAALLQPAFREAIEGKVAGTSGSHQRVRPDDLLSTPVLDPRLLEPAAASAVTDLMSLAEQAREESFTLAALRDTLLPELMSGRLRVKDAEHQVGEVV